MYRLVLFLFISNSLQAQTPNYCPVETNIQCTEEIASAGYNIENIEKVKKKIGQNNFIRALKNTAILKLTSNKSELLAPFPELYNKPKDHKIYYYGLEKQKSRNHHANFTHLSVCFRTDNNLKDNAEKIDNEFKALQLEKANKDNQLDILTNVFLGAIPAEMQLNKRPLLNQKIKKEKENLAYSKKLLDAGETGILNIEDGITTSTSPCYGISASITPKLCEDYKERLKELSTQIDKDSKKITLLEIERELGDEYIFKNPMYTTAKGPLSTFITNKQFEPTSIITEGLAEIKKYTKTGDLSVISDLIMYSDQIKQETGIDGEQMARSTMKDFISSNPSLFAKLKNIYQKNLKNVISQNDEAIKDICLNDGEDLIANQDLVDLSRESFLKDAEESLGNSFNKDELTLAYNLAHCEVLAESQEEGWFESMTGYSGLKSTKLGSGLTAFGLGVASAFGCVPCLPASIASGLTATGIGAYEASKSQDSFSINRGLANVSLSDQRIAKDYFDNAITGWAFVGIDLALTPLGLKTGQVLRTGQALKRAQKSFSNSSLKDRPELTKSLLNHLPESEFDDAIEAISKLSTSEKNLIASELDKLKSLPKEDHYQFISSTLKKYQVDLPASGELYVRSLRELSNDSDEFNGLRLRYEDQLNKHGITPGTEEEIQFLQIAHIHEKSGCTGLCLQNPKTKENVVKKIDESLTCKL